MRLNHALCLAVVICLVSMPLLDAQKGGKPKPPADQSVTAKFRCDTLDPLAPCVPDGLLLSDAITGDGSTYVGVGDWQSGSGAFLRAADGEFSLDINAGGNRWILLDFRHVVLPPSGFHRKTFETVKLDAFHLNTNVIDPATGLQAADGLRSIPVGAQWPSLIKAGWADTYGFLYNIRFNPEGFPGSTNIAVTRVSQNSWTIEATELHVARLVSPPQSGKGKPTGPTDEGLYTMPFKITVTAP
jgi:hypothetical protein